MDTSPSRSPSGQLFLRREVLEDEPKPFYEVYASSYQDWTYPLAIREFQQAEKHFLIENVAAGSTLIDIGCGPGEHIAAILNKKCKITAVDFVPEMIRIAKLRVGTEVHFICDDVMRLSFSKNAFDYGVCYCTLPNQLDYKSFFKKISFFSKRLIISIYDWQARNKVVEFYRINGLNPVVHDQERAVILSEGLRYLFLPEEEVLGMFNENRYDVTVLRQSFGNIYFGIKNGSG
jgi:SAM-dependent methyltransferase